MILIARFGYRHQAELALGYLQDAGIEAVLSIDDSGGADVGLAFSNPARLMVRAQDAAMACEILESAGIEVIRGWKSG